MTKFKLYYDKDKETEWLNEMAEKGQAMTGFFAGFYQFVLCEPGEYVYQIDLNTGLWKVSVEYREFMEEMGVEIVALWGPWVVLRKKAAQGEFQMYTDTESRIESYTKIRNTFKIVTLMEAVCFGVELYGAMLGVKQSILFMIIIGAIMIATMQVAFKTNQRILKLKEETTEETKDADKRVTNLMIAGLFLNTCAAMIPETVTPAIKSVFLLGALAIMLYGLYQVARNRRMQNK